VSEPARERTRGLRDRAPLLLAAAVATMSPEGRAAYGSLKHGLRTAVARDPLDATLLTVLGGAFLFYVAERVENPKVRTYWDALVFVSTCLSVGYADVFARTSAGKAIASALMTFGPAISGAILEEPRRDADPSGIATPRDADREESATPAQMLALQRVIADKLEAILGELRKG
jgi:voltage-gated potassium channel